VSDGILSYSISELRKAFGDDAKDPRIIETIPRKGYRLIAPVAHLAPAFKSQPSIAVMPFFDMSAEKDQEYFCDGIAEEIINDLAHVRGLRVAARTSSFSFKGKSEDVRSIGRALGVDTVLEGCIRKAGNQLRITAQLINVADGYHLWSERYDREMKDVFAIQDEIARSIAATLKITLSPKEKDAISKIPTTDLQAYDYYLRGRQFYYQYKRKGIECALKLFSHCIALDPAYARAYARHCRLQFIPLPQRGQPQGASRTGRFRQPESHRVEHRIRRSSCFTRLGTVTDRKARRGGKRI